MVIGSEVKQRFLADGAIKLPNFLDDAALERCRECYDWSVKHPGPFSAYEGSYNDIANPEAVKVYESMLRAIPFGDFLAELWESENVWFWAEEILVKEAGTKRTYWHQDTMSLPFTGEHLANFWITFESLPKTNSLEIVRASHHGPLYQPRCIPDIEAERRQDPTSWDVLSWAITPGDVIVFHPGALHGGAPVDAAHPDRHSLSLRFFGEDTTYRPPPGNPRASTEYRSVVELRPASDPTLKDGDPYRSSRFLQLR